MPIKNRIVPTTVCTIYTEYRQTLREECCFTCVYCDLTENEIGGANSFEIDHYAPASKFPNLKCTYSNLLYSCNFCNRSKGAYWASDDQKAKGEYFLSPYLHDLDCHLDKAQPKWLALSDAGIWNIRRLSLASDTLQKIRSRRKFATQDSLAEEVLTTVVGLLRQHSTIPAELERKIEECISNERGLKELQAKRLDARIPEEP